MDKQTALMVIHARLLGASYRRIAELLGGDSQQSTGMCLVAEASINLGIDPSHLDSKIFEKDLDDLHYELGIFTVEEVAQKILNGAAK